MQNWQTLVGGSRLIDKIKVFLAQLFGRGGQGLTVWLAHMKDAERGMKKRKYVVEG